ncbi:MAG: hypothetical protein N2C12_01520, partial [Planctomycetales bacterium]
GLKRIEVVEDNLSVKIVDDPKTGIKMQVSRDGEEQTEYMAAGAAELERDHPEAFKLYKKYAAGDAVQARAAIPILQPRLKPNQLPRIDRQQIHDRMRAHIEGMIRQIEAHHGGRDMQPTIDRLRRQIERLEGAVGDR